MDGFYEIRRNKFSVKNNKAEVKCRKHLHDDIEILHVRRGVQHLVIDNREYTLSKGQTAVIFPNTVHEYKMKSENPDDTDAMLIICSKKFYRQFFPGLSEHYSKNPIIEEKQLHPDAKYAFMAVSSDMDINLQISWTVIILTRVLKSVKVLKRESSPIDDIGFKITRYIDEHFKEPITLKSLADELCVSETYVSKAFSQKLKMSFRRYLGLIRAEYATMLLRTTDEKIISIAEISGFQSISTFNRVFYDIYKMSPREFRDNILRYTDKQN